MCEFPPLSFFTMRPTIWRPVHEAPIANSGVHVQDLAGRHSCLPEKVIARIKAIIISQDEASLAECLSGESAQTLIDVVHEVCLRVK